jgi:hypothetical protein
VEQFIQDHNFIVNTQKKIEPLLQYKPFESVKPLYVHPEHNIFSDTEYLNLDKTNSDFLTSYSSTQQMD